MQKVNIFIVLGFLGSGKTTFLKKYLKIKPEKKTAIVVNEFGEVDVDAENLQKLNYKTKEITNGSIFCSCKSDKFLEVVIDLIKNGYENIVVESSGLSNPITLNKIMQYIDEKMKCNIKVQTLGIADARILYKLINTNIIIKQQIIASDLIILNKIDLASPSEIETSCNEIKKYNKNVEIIKCSYCDFDFEKLKFNESIKKYELNTKMVDISKKILDIKEQPIHKIQEYVERILKDVLRVKGFVKAKEGWFFVDGTLSTLEITPSNSKEYSRLVVLYSGDVELEIL